MENSTEKTDRYFRERLEQFEQSPDDAIWENLARELGHKKKRNLVPVFRIAAGMTIIMSLGVGGYFITKKQQPAELVATVNGYSKTSDSDTLTRARAARKNTGAVPVKKAPKSDRTDHIRKFQRLPNVEENDQSSELQPAKSSPAMFQNPVQNNQELYGAFNEISGKKGRVCPLHLLRRGYMQQDHYQRQKGKKWRRKELAYNTDYYTSDSHNKGDRWIVGGEFAPLYSYRTVASNSLKSASIDELNGTRNRHDSFCRWHPYQLSCREKVDCTVGYLLLTLRAGKKQS